jgi:hypothetical protein
MHYIDYGMEEGKIAFAFSCCSRAVLSTDGTIGQQCTAYYGGELRGTQDVRTLSTISLISNATSASPSFLSFNPPASPCSLSHTRVRPTNPS